MGINVVQELIESHLVDGRMKPQPGIPMSTAIIQNFEKILSGGKDSTLLRFSLGNEYLKTGDPASAVNHLKQAVVLDQQYSAAWKLLGRALVESGQPADALVAYREGIAVAEAKGDKQAAKEMTVYARRIEKSVDDDRNGSHENG